jgi:hypothetical protein
MGFLVGRGPEIYVGGDLETCHGSLEKDTEASCPTIKRCEFSRSGEGFNGTRGTTMDRTACELYELDFKGLLLQNASPTFEHVGSNIRTAAVAKERCLFSNSV